LTEEELSTMITDADSDGDGLLSAAEFESARVAAHFQNLSGLFDDDSVCSELNTGEFESCR
jgi:hypothetical protein